MTKGERERLARLGLTWRRGPRFARVRLDLVHAYPYQTFSDAALAFLRRVCRDLDSRPHVTPTLLMFRVPIARLDLTIQTLIAAHATLAREVAS